MTNFLPAGMMNENLEELQILAASLASDPDLNPTQREKVCRMQELALELLSLINGFNCQPLMYTGTGSTEEVIERLEWLLTFADGATPPNRPRSRRRNKSRQ